MNKALFLAISAVFLAAGCASTSTSSTAASGNTITLEEALQKSAETRQKLIDAKQSYQNAKTAAEVASGQKTAADAAKEQFQQKADAAKQQIENEKSTLIIGLAKQYLNGVDIALRIEKLQAQTGALKDSCAMKLLKGE